MNQLPESSHNPPHGDHAIGGSPIEGPSTSPAVDPTRGGQRRLPAVLHSATPYLTIAVFALVLLRSLCAGSALYWGDILLYFNPMGDYAKHELMAGRLPLWNSSTLCGQPYIGNPQLNVFYPSAILLYFFPVWLAVNITTILHVFLCGAFMYLFLRRWTINTVPALAGALVYMGSANILGRLQFPPMVQTAAYFPLLFWVLDRNVDKPSTGNRLFLSITVALTLLAAHTQVAYLAFGSGAVYAMMRLWRRRGRPARSESTAEIRSRLSSRWTLWFELARTMVRAAPFAAAGVFGLVLAAIYLLPAIQLIHDSSREQMSVSQANRFFADLPHILAVIFPRFTGHPASRDFWARGNAWEPAWFVGWAPLALAGYAAARCRKENLVKFWLVTGLVGFWLALGSLGGLYWLAFYAVPGVASFHDPARFLLCTTMAAAALTAVGLDALQVRHRRFARWDLLTLAAIIVPLVWFGGDWIPTTAPDNLALLPAAYQETRRIVGGDRIMLPSSRHYWRRIVGDGYADYGASAKQYLQHITDTLLSNLEMRIGFDSASGYEPVPVGSYAALESLSELAQLHREPTTERLLSLLDVKVLLVSPTGGNPAGGYRLAGHHDHDNRALTEWIPLVPVTRAWMVWSARRIEGRTRITTALTAPDFDPLRTAIVSGAAAGDLKLPDIAAEMSADRVSPILLNTKEAAHVHLSVDAGMYRGLLVYSGTAFPGWKATVDGRLTRVVCTDGTLIGVPLNPGHHSVDLTYAPDMFRVGLYGTLAGLFALSAVYVGARVSGQLSVARTAPG